MVEGVNANIGAIEKMEEACARFSRAILERLPDVTSELRRVTEALEERSDELHREISRLEEEIESADEDDDTSWARNRLEEAQEERASLQRRLRKLEEAGATYLALARQAEHLSTAHTVKAKEYLRGAADDLKAYFALTTNSSVPKDSNGSAAGPRLPNDLPRNGSPSQVAEALKRDARLAPAKWKQLGYEQRLSALRDAEAVSAAIQLRQQAVVNPHFLPTKNGRYRFGWYDKEENTIYVGQFLLDDNEPTDAVDTVLHEGRHAYQYHAVQNPHFHSNNQEVLDWNREFNNYVKSDDDPELYFLQKIERDARDYANRVVTLLYS